MAVRALARPHESQGDEVVPMPHRTFAQVARRRLVGKEGTERVKVLRALLEELPDYRSGPYADLRKWLNDELEQTRVRAKVVHRDSISIRREGVAQVAFVGAPNAGKSSLLQALSQIQIKTGDYAFTTTRPVAALTRIGGVLVQLVEIPGLLEGAHENRGGGRALLGVLRNADAIVYCQPASSQPDELAAVRREVSASSIELPALLAVTKVDEAGEGDLARLSAAFDELEVVPVSVLDDASLDRLREAVWALTGLIRVYLRHGREVDEEPLALHPDATVEEVAHQIHHDLAESFQAARIWGPSARFEGQRVGRGHVVVDGDVVEIVR
jgi:small GTP-binding protein